MDYGRENGDVVQIVAGGGGGGSRNELDNWGDQPVWATEDEYGVWDREASVDAGGRQDTPSKKPRNGPASAAADGRSKAIGKMFFKTKLCCKFRAGTCPYVTNCNFAHSVEELRRPPPNWQEIVAAHEDDRGGSCEPREEFQIPSLGSASFTADAQRSYKGRHCKKFYTEEGCPYGESCTYLHDEQSRARESVAISLGPGYGGGAVGRGGGGGNGGGTPEAAANSILKPSNWKTRICNKWEQTGYCPFGSKCHFAHGSAELHRFGGGLADTDTKDPTTPVDPTKQGPGPGPVSLKNPADVLVASGPSDGYQRLPGVAPRTGLRPFQKWKGPDRISRIYGDWIDDVE